MRLALAVALLGAAVVTANLFRIQVLRHERYLAEAERQHKQKIVLPARRGHIFDRNGEPLAVSAEGLNVYAVPEQIENKRATAATLAEQLGLESRSVLGRISNDRPFVMIQQKVNPLEIEHLRSLNLPGIGFIPSSKRYYPHHTLAAQLIGYVGIDEEGLTGLEFQYDKQMRGTPGWLVVQRDARGRPYNLLDYPVVRQQNGNHLRLTLDAEFQEIVEAELTRAITESGARNGCAIAVRPSTGEILALANYPPVDLNDESSFAREGFKNIAANSPFEPGSTMKPFTGSALLAGGYTKLGDHVFCENGAWVISARRTLRDTHHFGDLNFLQVITHSSNVGMGKLIQRIPDAELYRTLRALGFGQYTGQCFGGEDKGILPEPSKWDKTTKTSLAIGYNLMVTPLQMAMAYGALANGGILYEPALVSEVVDDSGQRVSSFTPRMVRRALDEQAVLQMRRAMVSVVDSGTGIAAQVPGFKVAGKTGTSMKAHPGGGYNGAGYISSFGGYFPADDAQIAMYIMINDPDYQHRWGGSCAAPVFGESIRKTLLSRSSVLDRVKLGLPSAEMKVAAATPVPSPLAAIHEPAAQAVHSPQPDTDSESLSQGAVVAPDVREMTIRLAAARLEKLGLKVNVTGAVRVLGQNPPPGSSLRPGEVVTLTGMPVDIRNNSVSHTGETEQARAELPARKQSQGEVR